VGGGRAVPFDVAAEGIAGLVGVARSLLRRAQEEKGLPALAGRGVFVQEGDERSDGVFESPLPVVDLGRASDRAPPVGVLGGVGLGDGAVDGQRFLDGAVMAELVGQVEIQGCVRRRGGLVDEVGLDGGRLGAGADIAGGGEEQDG